MAAHRPSPLLGPPPRRPPRRSRLLQRLVPLMAFAAVAFVVGIVLGSQHEPSERRVAARFAAAWERGDYATMPSLLTSKARAEFPLRRFVRAYERAADTATLSKVTASPPRVLDGGEVRLDMKLATRIFGTFSDDVTLTVEKDEDGTPGIAWRPEQVFPGLLAGERLARETQMPPRAAIQARDGTVIAHGEARLSELGPIASEIAGRLGPAPPEREEEAAVTALAGRFGGIAVMRPRDGEVLALAGIAYSAPQPPGSTFKIVTLAGLLDSGTVKRNAKFPVETKTTLEGVELENANGEACGGSLRASFAESCNSVFAPLGAELGAERLVATAEKFGFNEEPGLPGAARSTIPAAAEVGDDLAVGSTAIGQGKVLATPLLMADVASAIAQDGRRPKPTLLKGAGGVADRATTPETARFIARAMRSVVTDGTGIGAAVPGVKVAGKTGTAELRSTVSEDPIPEDPTQPPQEEDLTDTDAWFTAFAPLREPKVAVAVLLVGQGAGGATAAPAAKTVIEAALKN